MTIPFIQQDVKPSVNELRLDLAYFFPELTHFYGYAGTPDHNTKRCLDAMVYDSSKKYVEQQGRSNLPYNQRIALGDRVLAFLRKNANHYGLNGVIWNRHVYGFPHASAPSGKNHFRGPYNVARAYTQSAHDDHLHIDQDGSTFKPLRPTGPVVALPTYYVDPAKVDTFLWAVRHADGIPALQRPPRFAITTAQQIVTIDGKQWVLTQAGYRYALDYLTTKKPDPAPKPVTPPKPVDPKPVPTVHTTNIVYANILRRTDTEPGRKRWPARKANVVKHLKSGKPSVVLACECDKETADDIATGLGPSWSYYPSQFATGKTFSPLAVFWDSNIWERKEDSFVKEYSDNENRFLQRQPLVHKASGKTVWFYASHLENEGDTETDGHKARLVEAGQWADWTLSGPGVWGADLNSTTRSGAKATTRERQKPRPILKAAGWKMLSDQSGVAGREFASHHGGKGSTPKGAWIDDVGFKGVTYVDGSLIRTDGTDASDHHFLSITIEL